MLWRLRQRPVEDGEIAGRCSVCAGSNEFQTAEEARSSRPLYGEKPEPVKTHLRNMVIVLEMIGSLVAVYQGEQCINVEVKPERDTTSLSSPSPTSLRAVAGSLTIVDDVHDMAGAKYSVSSVSGLLKDRKTKDLAKLVEGPKSFPGVVHSMTRVLASTIQEGSVRKPVMQSQRRHEAGTDQEVEELLGCIDTMDDHASKNITRIPEHRLDQKVKTMASLGRSTCCTHRVTSVAMKERHKGCGNPGFGVAGTRLVTFAGARRKSEEDSGRFHEVKSRHHGRSPDSDAAAEKAFRGRLSLSLAP